MSGDDIGSLSELLCCALNLALVCKDAGGPMKPKDEQMAAEIAERTAKFESMTAECEGQMMEACGELQHLESSLDRASQKTSLANYIDSCNQLLTATEAALQPNEGKTEK
eukprot:CAMPEP_0113849052 /NCGR_PEP_ID=MMETSP0372-20130328/2869_1 /TAXON_ID=340204 /ORGANISM="Lankesteria abbotti" /LENGTH=109 /DNA_ID=CAMNT_0000818705 /DNA_START=110 /DNA_END=439 /DNA_ORIENTATION=+ /assembly_acc=CAM_ASM_000359